MNSSSLITKGIILLTASVLTAPSISASMLTPPSLGEVIRNNNETMKTTQIEEKKNTTIETNNSETTSSTGKKVNFVTLEDKWSIKISRAKEENLWMQEVRLDMGAKVQMILSDPVSYNNETWEPQFQKKTLEAMKNTLGTVPFSMTNGQFYDPRREPTELSFGLKSDGIIRSAGADNGKIAKNILIIGEKDAQVVPYSWENLRDTYGANAIVTLSMDAPNYSNVNIGRTYICLKDPDAENKSSTLLVFTAEAMNERNMESIMTRAGCTRKSIAKFDASGSAQLWYNNEKIYGVSHKGDPDKRKIPNALAFFAK